MPLNAVQSPSPNHSDRQGTPVSLVVLHYTGMETGREALDRLRDPEAGVSAHYFIEEDGTLHAMVEESSRAHHAGLGYWDGIQDVNAASIGIEIVNPGHYWGYQPFPETQMVTLIELLEDIFSRHKLSVLSTIGHSDLAPERKEDPGELFPWARLAELGLALPQWQKGEEPPAPEYDEAIAMLAEIGYGVSPSHPVAAILAFQRRFAPQLLGQGISPDTRMAIRWVHGQVMKARLG